MHSLGSQSFYRDWTRSTTKCGPRKWGRKCRAKYTPSTARATSRQDPCSNSNPSCFDTCGRGILVRFVIYALAWKFPRAHRSWSLLLFFTDAEVRVSIDPATQEIAIVSCTMDAPSSSSTTDFVSAGCVTKWKGKFK